MFPNKFIMKIYSITI